MKYLTILAILLISCHTIAYKQRYVTNWHNASVTSPKVWHKVKRHLRDSTLFTDRGAIIEFQQDELLINKYWK